MNTNIGPVSIDSASVASSASNASIQNRCENMKHYTEQQRLTEVHKYHTTLEETQKGGNDDFGAGASPEDENYQNQIASVGHISDQSSTINAWRIQSQSQSWSGNHSDQLGKKLFQRMRRFLFGRLFKINHVLLNNQVVTSSIYQIIILFEFLQLMYFAFINVDIYNEFSTTSDLIYNNGTNISINGTIPIDNSQQTTTADQNVSLLSNVTLTRTSFRLDPYLEFTNFQYYPLENHYLNRMQSSFSDFTIIYATLNTCFLSLLIVMYTMSEKLFRQVTKAHHNEGMLILVKALSAVMILFLSIFEIPMLMINLQVYQCDEDQIQDRSLGGLNCGTTLSQILIISSTLIILMYLAFLYMQSMLYTTCNFNALIPWSSLDRDLIYVKILWKFVIAVGFQFDKLAEYKSITCLISSAFAYFITYRRLKSAIIFNQQIYHAQAFYESLLAWLFLCLSILHFGSVEFTLSLMIGLFTSGFFISAGIIIRGKEIRHKEFMQSMDFRNDKVGKTNLQAQLILFQLLMNTQDMDLQGTIDNHMDNCTVSTCMCHTITSPLEVRELRIQIRKEWNESKQRKKLVEAQRVKMLVDANLSQNIHVLPKISKQITPVIPNFDRSMREYASGMTDVFISTPEVYKTLFQQQDEEPPSQGMLLKNMVNFGTNTIDLKKSDTTASQSLKMQSQQTNIKNLTSIRQKMSMRSEQYNTDKSSMHWRSLTSYNGDINSEGNFINGGMSQLNEEQMEEEKQLINEEEAIIKYRFLSLILQKLLKSFPKSSELRIHSSYIQQTYLNNEFKANFELMQTELCEPSIQNRFFIFRRRIDIDNILMNKNDINVKRGCTIDPQSIYIHEKYVQRYMKLQYMAANSALNFWRELMQRHNVDVEMLKEKGVEIFKNYETIRYLSDELMKQFPNDISFILHYCVFLKHIVNYDQEAQLLFQSAQQTFARMIQSKKRGISNGKDGYADEISMFGENTATAIIIISLTATTMGTIMHTNDEIMRVLNYGRRELIGQKINCIQPQVIANVHDKILKQFSETAKRTVMDNFRQLFAINKDGYLRPINLIVKLYPHMTDKIIVVGFVQSLSKLDHLEPTKTEGFGATDTLSNLPHHYILTDSQGNIQCVSEGMGREVGMNPKFFVSTEIFSTSVSIDKIFNNLRISNGDDINGYQNEEERIAVMSEGIDVTIDTSHILQHVNIEQLSSEEIQEVKATQGTFQAQIMLKRLIFDEGNCIVDLYRVILFPESINTLDENLVKGLEHHFPRNTMSRLNLPPTKSRDHTFRVESLSDFDAKMSMSQSQSSACSTNSSQAQNKMIQDFKASINQRKRPKHLVNLSRILSFILIITIVISTTDYFLKIKYLSQQQLLTDKQMYGEGRTIQFIQMISSVRSFVNLANGFEFESYSKSYLKRIDRFSYLKQFIQTYAFMLSDTNNFLTMQRTGADDKAGIILESQPIDLFRLSSQNSKVSSFKLPYRLALQTFLDDILELNVTSKQNITLSDNLISEKPQLNGKSNQTASRIQTEIYFIVTNAYRSLLKKSQEAQTFLQDTVLYFSHSTMVNEFLSIMIVGIIVSSVTLLLIGQEMRRSQQNQARIMSIFALISKDEIKKVYDLCDQYIDRFDGNSEEQAEVELTASQKQQQQQQQEGPKENDYCNKIQAAPSNHNLFSEQYQNNNMFDQTIQVKKRQMPHKQYNSAIDIQEYYSQMLRKTFDQIKEEEELISEPKPKRKTEQPIQYNEQEDVSVNDIKVKTRRKSHFFGGKIKPSKESSSSTKLSLNKTAKIGATPNTLKHRFAIKDEEDDSRFESSKSKLNFNEESPAKKQVSERDSIEDQNEIARRKQMLKVSNSNQKSLFLSRVFLMNLGILSIFIVFFSFGYLYHKSQLSQLEAIEELTPLFLERYQHLYLSFGYLREKILSNNHNFTELGFYPDLEMQQNAQFKRSDNFLMDEYHHAKSMEIERGIQKFKVSKQEGVSKILSFIKNVDSDLFCAEIFKVTNSSDVQMTSIDKNVEATLLKIKNEAYQTEIQTVIAACIFSSQGKLDELIKLIEKGNTNLNIGDYDNRTPLHVAAASGMANIVQYLLSQNVNPSPIDRWGATPLNDATPYPEIQKILLSKGGILGKNQPPYEQFQVTVTDDQFRSYYAAYYGDVAMMENLILFGWNINGQDYDGRTALGVASSQGQLAAVKYLIQKGATIFIKDARGNDPLDDARRENRGDVIDYLINFALVRNLCTEYEDGMFKQGLSSAIASFNRKFSDIQIIVNRANQTSSNLLYLLGASKLNNQLIQIQATSTLKSIEVFFTTSELYLFKVIERQYQIMHETYDDYRTNYYEIIEIMFFVFLTIQIISLFYMRSRLIEKFHDGIMQSRGILNLVPERFFNDHQHEVEDILKIMNQ